MAFRNAHGSRQAAGILQSEAEAFKRPFQLTVNFSYYSIEHDEWGFDLFLTALERSGEQLTRLQINRGVFHESDDNTLVTRFLGQVLAVSLKSLTDLTLSDCKLCPAHVDLLAASFSQSNSPQQQQQQQQSNSSSSGQQQRLLRTLNFWHTPLDRPGVVALSRLLLPSSSKIVQLQELRLIDCGIGSSECQLLFLSLDGNRHLKELCLAGNDITDFNAKAVQTLGNSNLQILHLFRNPVTDQGVRVLADGLRVNEKLKQLSISPRDPSGSAIPSEPFIELLSRFNIQLCDVQITHIRNRYIRDSSQQSPSQQRIDELVLVNLEVQKAHCFLECQNYNLPLLAVWPYALEKIDSKPSLLYRFVRQGNNLENLINLLVVGQKSINDNFSNNICELPETGSGCGILDMIALEEEDEEAEVVEEPQPIRRSRTIDSCCRYDYYYSKNTNMEDEDDDNEDDNEDDNDDDVEDGDEEEEEETSVHRRHRHHRGWQLSASVDWLLDRSYQLN